MERHRRSIALAASVSAAALLLAGCSGPTSAEDGAESQTITFAYPVAGDAQDKYQPLAEKYMETHPGVKVETRKYGYENFGTTLQTQLQGGNGPDLFHTLAGTGESPSIGPLAEAGLLLPLDTEVIENSLPDAMRAGWAVAGNYYGVPTSAQVNGLVVNGAQAKKLGVQFTDETTLEELVAQCDEALSQGVSILGFAGAVPFTGALAAFGFAASTVYGPEPDWNERRAAGKVTFADSDGWKAALQAIKTLDAEGCFQGGATGAGLDALTNGVAGQTILGFAAPSSAVSTLAASSGGKLEMSVLPMPAPENFKPMIVLSTAEGIAGNGKTQSPMLVQDFLQWTTQPEQAALMAQAQDTLAVADPSANLPAPYESVRGLLESGSIRTASVTEWPNGAVNDELGTGVTGILTGQMTIEQVLEAMDAAWGPTAGDDASGD